ncbi:TerC family protein [Miltoncostaea marina]|uniref:TerC family protein n=1 Tax=Miltoncostaea marina TaxID=2843215 RepID=UPI001C3E39F7|nr:TerC family protein [Miltoncostaea marina]
MAVPLWAWGAVIAFTLALLALDLFVLHREAHEVTLREAAWMSGLYAAAGLGFGAVVWAWRGPEAGGEYLAGYLIEKSLSVDNIFVFALIFSYFGIPARYQHRVLFWGVIGAIAFRALFIALGAALLDNVDWIVYVFGAFLVYTGVRMARGHTVEVHPDRNPVIRLMRRLVPVTGELRGQRFLLREGGRWVATPLLAALVMVETMDVVFAVDSVPAIFAITDDVFIVFTANVFAILGLRALYFLLAGTIPRFAYLQLGLALVLVFVGAKMFLTDVGKLPVWISLGVIAAIIGASVAASLWTARRDRGGAPPAAGAGAA